jgi:hypothetical protein
MRSAITRELAEMSCECCGQVCDDGCRRAAVRDRVLLQQLWLGVRL